MPVVHMSDKAKCLMDKRRRKCPEFHPLHITCRSFGKLFRHYLWCSFSLTSSKSSTCKPCAFQVTWYIYNANLAFWDGSAELSGELCGMICKLHSRGSEEHDAGTFPAPGRWPAAFRFEHKFSLPQLYLFRSKKHAAAGLPSCVSQPGGICFHDGVFCCWNA